MEGSYLSVKVIEARNLRAVDDDQGADPYVRLSIEGQTKETVFQEGTLNPKWNQTFKLDINTGSEDLEVLVLDRDLYASDDFQGKVVIPLETLRDQMKMDTWYDLQSTNPAERWQGEIRIETQWIHSRVKFFSSLIKKLDQLISADEQDRSNIEKHLGKVRAPFVYLDYMDYGHFNINDVETAQEAASGGCWARWILFEK